MDELNISEEEYYFTYTQDEYNENRWVRELLKNGEKKKPKEWTYKQCKVQLVGTKNNKTRVVLRRVNSRYSSVMKFNYTVNLMMGFVVNKVYEPKPEKIPIKEKKIDAWVINFEVEEVENPNSSIRPITNVKIWIPEGTGNIKNSQIYKLWHNIDKQRSVTKIFESNVEKESNVMPVIYQPYIDAWKNFLREVHVHPLSEKDSNTDFEVTLIFNDEILRAHAPLDIFYRGLRALIHKRIKDVETFCMHLEGDGNFKFPGIYSDEEIKSVRIKNTIFEDDIHGHKPKDYPDGVPEVSIKYYFQSENHPIVFVNTSNHALSEGDNNHDIWKWEYTPWTKGIPIETKKQSRETIDDSFRIIKHKFWRKVFGIKEKENKKCKD